MYEVENSTWSVLKFVCSFITEAYLLNRDPYNSFTVETTAQVCLECTYGPMYYLACQHSI